MLYQLFVYVPKDHCENVKKALFEAGAGKYENYEECSWQTEGLGQFKPILDACPSIGRIGKLETLKEIKIETVCTAEVLHSVLNALKASHPYEEPAYGVVEIKTLEDF